MSVLNQTLLLSSNHLSDLLKTVESKLSHTITDLSIERQVSDMCQTVISAGGKRIRPKIALLCATSLPNYTQDFNEKITSVAAALELLHTATLIHDDVIDESPLRRGHDTLNATEGNHIAVLAGDYMFTRCFITLQSALSVQIITEFSKTLGTLVAGELFQLEHEGDLSITYEQYEQIIYAKTGALFELAASSVAIVLEESEQTYNALKEYGRQIGIAFQVIDDVLDYNSDNKTLGKVVGEDLQDKRITLPLIITLEKLSGEDKEQFIKAIESVDLTTVMQYIQKTDALRLSYDYAKKAIDKALDCLNVLKDCESKTILENLTLKIIDRNN